MGSTRHGPGPVPLIRTPGAPSGLHQGGVSLRTGPCPSRAHGSGPSRAGPHLGPRTSPGTEMEVSFGQAEQADHCVPVTDDKQVSEPWPVLVGPSPRAGHGDQWPGTRGRAGGLAFRVQSFGFLHGARDVARASRGGQIPRVGVPVPAADPPPSGRARHPAFPPGRGGAGVRPRRGPQAAHCARPAPGPGGLLCAEMGVE